MDTINMINITPLVEAVILVLAAVVTTYLVPWIKTRLTSEQLSYARTAVEIAVYAAEKAYGAGKGEQKLKYVEEALAARGVKLDTMSLKTMVDAEIKKMEQMETPVLMTGEIESTEEEETEDDEEPQTEEPEPKEAGE